MLYSVRVLHITRDFPPRTNGGISTAVGGMVGYCSRTGIECAVVSFDAWRPRGHEKASRQEHIARVGSAPVQESGFGSVMRLTSPDQVPAAHAFVDSFLPTIVHVHHGMLWPFAEDIRARLSIPAIVQIHVVQAAQDRLRGLVEPTRSARSQLVAMRAADLVVAPSRAAAGMLAAEYLDLPGRVRVLGLGIDDTQDARRAVAARALATDAGGVGPVLYVGRFADMNGTAELFAAIPEILERVPGARFVIAGGIPDNPKAERRWLRRWRERAPASVQARVELPGWQSRTALARLYSRASVLVSPSWLETFGLVVLEAMLHGLPVVATRSGGVEELLDHGRTGMLAAVRDVEQLSAHVVELLTRPERAQALGQAAAARVRERHLWEHTGPTLHALYRELSAG